MVFKIYSVLQYDIYRELQLKHTSPIYTNSDKLIQLLMLLLVLWDKNALLCTKPYQMKT